MSKELYKTSITTFVDVIGFREIVKKTPSTEISKSLSIIRKLQEQNSDKTHNWLKVIKSDYKQINFSDSTVRSVSYDEKDIFSFIASFTYEIENLILIQRSLVESSILLRGGVAHGNLHISKEEVFGPGLVKAYDFESKFAIYPRIVIDPILMKILNSTLTLLTENHTREDKEEMAFLMASKAKKSIMRSDDGLYFIDYLSYIPDEDTQFDLLGFEDLIIQHREVIKLNTIKELPPDVQIKYNWLSDYHNRIVMKNSSFFKNPNETYKYKITENENPYII